MPSFDAPAVVLAPFQLSCCLRALLQPGVALRVASLAWSLWSRGPLIKCDALDVAIFLYNIKVFSQKKKKWTLGRNRLRRGCSSQRRGSMTKGWVIVSGVRNRVYAFAAAAAASVWSS